MAITIPFRRNAPATEAHMAAILKPQGYRVYGTWDNRGEEAVHITGADQPMGSGVFVADGQQLIVRDDGTLSVEGCGRA